MRKHNNMFMRIHLGFFSTFLMLSLTSCGELNSSLESISPAIPHELIYQTQGDCETGDLSFNYLVAAGTQLWTDPAQILTAQSELYLSKDGTYLIRYREFQNVEGTTVYDSNFSGRYFNSSDNGRIRFENLGEGKVQSWQGKYYLDFQYTSRINSEALVGKKARFRVMSSLTTWNNDRAQYCGY
ncbi:hypothetical protein [Bdellovibrio reynosensis]|uniref:Lipoprotein n=1 Tax=Bdellovibrio reynosensis TaxID=2835041 RepID=A0ABY4CB96_9BACT|nr:hypothetical protein [Bdellovibrio reynosensis]UOF02217.1 hypothetical protein MNR06_04545 [Bdellovibrio reynosensis]